jgi:hypothetical protein
MTHVSLAQRPELYGEANRLVSSCWPEFMLHDSVANRHFFEFVQTFPDHQFILLDDSGDICGMVNSVPLSFPKALESLNDGGWDWAVIKSLEDRKKGLVPDTLVGLQVCIDPRLQGNGLSARAVDIMRRFRSDKGYRQLVIPVRPTCKHHYPLIPMADYIAWFRVHFRQGGQILRPCEHSMRIEAPLADWEAWTGLTFIGSGRYIVSGALCPLNVDREKDTGVYVEPNVWVVHRA